MALLTGSVLSEKAECLTGSRYPCTKNGKSLTFENSRLMLEKLVFNYLIICFPIHFNLGPLSSFQLSWLQDWVSRTPGCNRCNISSHIHQDLHFPLSLTNTTSFMRYRPWTKTAPPKPTWHLESIQTLFKGGQ